MATRFHTKGLNVPEDETTIGEILSVDGDIVYQDNSEPTRLAASTATNQVLSLSTATDGLVPAWDYGGIVIQRRYTQVGTTVTATNIIPGDDTVPTATEGTEGMSLGIEPLATDSRLRIEVVPFVGADADVLIISTLVNGAATAATLAIAENNGGANNLVTTPFFHEVDNTSTATVTWSYRVGPSSAANVNLNGNQGSGRFFGGAGGSSMTIYEMK